MQMKISNRFSARYRNDISGRGATLRATTGVPAYVPTVPTVTPNPSVSTFEKLVIYLLKTNI